MNKVELDGSDKIKFDGTSYSTELLGSTSNTGKHADKNALITIQDGAYVNGKALSYFADTAANKKSIDEVTFVDSDGNGKIDTAILTPKTSVKVTYVSTSEIVAGDTYKFADENIAEGFAKDDYAVVSKNLYKDNKDVAKATILNDTINGYKSKTGYVQYQIGSDWYNADAQFTDVDTGDKVKAYVFNGKVFDISADTSNGALPTVAVVTGIGGDTLTGDQVKLTFFDGTTQTVKLDKVVTSAGASSTAALGTAYSYTSSKDGYKLTQLESKKYNDYTALAAVTSFGNFNAASPNGTDFDGTADTVTIGGTTYKIADEAKIVLVQSTGKAKVVTGKQYNALNDAASGVMSAAFTKKVDGLTKVTLGAAYVADVDATGSSNDNYAYIVSDGYKTGDNYTKYTIWTGTENKTVVEKVSYSAGNRAKGMVVGYSTIDADGYINDVNAYAANTATPGSAAGYATSTLYYGGAQGVSGTSWVTMDGTNKLNVTNSTKILNVDSAADSDSDIGKSGNALFKTEEIASSGKYYVNAFYIMDETFGGNDNADLAFIVFDVKGKMKNYNASSVGSIATSGYTAQTLVDSKGVTATSVDAGSSYKLSMTASATQTNLITLTGAVFADTNLATKTVDSTSGVVENYTIIATGAASVTATAVQVTVAAAAQSGTITAADTTKDTATFAVTTTGVADGTAPVIKWYTTAGKAATATAPAGLAVSVTNVTTDAATVTMEDTTTANGTTAGTYYFTVTANGVESAVATLTIS